MKKFKSSHVIHTNSTVSCKVMDSKLLTYVKDEFVYRSNKSVAKMVAALIYHGENVRFEAAPSAFIPDTNDMSHSLVNRSSGVLGVRSFFYVELNGLMRLAVRGSQSLSRNAALKIDEESTDYILLSGLTLQA